MDGNGVLRTERLSPRSPQPSEQQSKAPYDLARAPVALADILDTVDGCVPIASVVGVGRQPIHPAFLNPIVGPTGQLPVPDRGTQGNGLPIERQAPTTWRQRRRNFVPTAAATSVHSQPERHRHIEHAVLQFGGHVLDESVLESVVRVHSESQMVLLVKTLPLTWYTEEYSLWKSE